MCKWNPLIGRINMQNTGVEDNKEEKISICLTKLLNRFIHAPIQMKCANVNNTEMCKRKKGEGGAKLCISF